MISDYNKELLDEVKELMFNGQWKDATIIFKKLNCSAAEYKTYIEELGPDDIYNFSMLGFYARNFIPTKRKENENI